MARPEVVLVVAVAKNGVIGRDNQLVWQIPEDMQHFKELTLGHAVLMGRKTWESLPPRFRPLPGRRNIVVTRQAGYAADGAAVAHSLDEALALAGGDECICVIGGAEIYAQSLPIADRLEITEVDLEPEGDAWFPPFPAEQWEETAREARVSRNGPGFSFVTLRRRG